jgi:hypothetical protein
LKRITENGLIRFVRKMADRLQGLQVVSYKSEGMSDAALLAIAGNCPNMKMLRITRPTRTSEEGIMAVLRGCPKLKKLSLDFAKEVGLEAFEFVAGGNAHNLKLLKVIDHPALMSNQDLCNRLRKTINKVNLK